MRYGEKCPHCKKDDCVKIAVPLNVEAYGDSAFHVRCKYCNEMIRVYGSLESMRGLNVIELGISSNNRLVLDMLRGMGANAYGVAKDANENGYVIRAFYHQYFTCNSSEKKPK